MWVDDYNQERYSKYFTTNGAQVPDQSEQSRDLPSQELTLYLLAYGIIHRFQGEAEGWHGVGAWGSQFHVWTPGTHQLNSSTGTMWCSWCKPGVVP